MGRTHFRGGCRLYNNQDCFRFKRQKAQMPLAPAAMVLGLCTRSVGRTGPRSQLRSSVPAPFFLEVVTHTQSHGKGRTAAPGSPVKLGNGDSSAVPGGWARRAGLGLGGLPRNQITERWVWCALLRRKTQTEVPIKERAVDTGKKSQRCVVR